MRKTKAKKKRELKTKAVSRSLIYFVVLLSLLFTFSVMFNNGSITGLFTYEQLEH